MGHSFHTRSAGEIGRRSGWITATIVMQGLWALALLGLPFYLLFLARAAAPEAASGLQIAFWILIVPALFAAISWYGLWNQKLWGWWLALVTDTGLTALLIYSMVDDGLRNIDWDVAGITAASVVVLLVLVLPTVRRFYWKIVLEQPLPMSS